MSICCCPDTPKSELQAMQKGLLQDAEWHLLSLQDMYRAGNTLQDITGVIPFRGGVCPRTMRCCGVCTRKCYHRCIQDCLHRLYMWRKLVENTPESERDQIPLNIRMIVTQQFESAEDLSWVVSEIIAQCANTKLKEYMNSENLRPEENPYKIDYAPQVAIDPHTGKRIVNRDTGELQIRNWPESGLCPFCLPESTVDRRYLKGRGTRRDKPAGPV